MDVAFCVQDIILKADIVISFFFLFYAACSRLSEQNYFLLFCMRLTLIMEKKKMSHTLTTKLLAVNSHSIPLLSDDIILEIVDLQLSITSLNAI